MQRILQPAKSRFGKRCLQTLAPVDTLEQARSVLLSRQRRQTTIEEMEAIGSEQTRETAFQPHQSLNAPIAPENVTLAHLLAANAHVGHHKSLSVSPAVYRYLYGTRFDISIIDVRETLHALQVACDVVRQVVQADGIVVFLGDQGPVGTAAIKNARRLKRNGYGTDRWQPGTITNAAKVFAASPLPTTGIVASEDAELTPNDFKPDLLILLSPTTSKAALKEATSANIPTIGIADTNIDPRVLTYPIPANDDSVRCVELIAGTLGIAGQVGLQARLDVEEQARKERNAPTPAFQTRRQLSRGDS